jgi:hypothetical protein
MLFWGESRVSAMKRKLAWVCLLILPLVLGGAAFCLSDADLITQASCDKIKKGMTVKEIEAILGRKEDRNFDFQCLQIYLWEGSRGYIRVTMQDRLDLKLLTGTDLAADEPLLVAHAHYYPTNRETIIDKIKKGFQP